MGERWQRRADVSHVSPRPSELGIVWLCGLIGFLSGCDVEILGMVSAQKYTEMIGMGVDVCTGVLERGGDSNLVMEGRMRGRYSRVENGMTALHAIGSSELMNGQ